MLPVNSANFVDAVLNHNKIVFFDNYLQTVSEMDLESGNTRILSHYEGVTPFYAAFAKMFNRKCFFFSNRFAKIIYYSIDEGIIGTILDDVWDEEGDDNICNVVSLSEDKVCCVPVRLSRNLFIIDLKTGIAKEHKYFMDFIRSCQYNQRESLSFPIIINHKLYASFQKRDMCIKYDINKDYGECFFPKKGISIRGICIIGETIYLAQTDRTSIVEVSLNVNEEKVLFRDDLCEMVYSHFEILRDETILVLPRFTDFVLHINQNNDVSCIKLPVDKGEVVHVLNALDMGDHILLFPYNYNPINYVYSINLKEKKVNRISIHYEDVKKAFTRIFSILSDKSFYCETELLDLKSYLKYIE